MTAATSVLGLWLFGSDPELRRQLVLVSLGFALVCVVAIALQQRSSGGWRPLDEVAAAAVSEAVEDAHGSVLEPLSMPRTIPSRRGRQLRSLAWVIGISTVLLGVIALTVGTPQRPVKVERLHSAGAEFGVARAEKISDVRRKSSRGTDPYVSTVVVQLPVEADGETVSATVEATTNEPLSPGDQVEVLYAPAQPRLGALAGNERSLGWKLRGETMPAYMRWLFVAATVLSWFLAVNHLSVKHGFRSFSQLGKKDKAIRGSYTRIGGHFDTAGRGSPLKGKHLEIQTDAGWVRFYTDAGKGGLPEAMEGQQLWLCWDAHRGARGWRISPRATPAALVFDTGLVVHGMMSVDQARSFNDSGVSIEKLSPVPGQGQPLRVFDPRSQWPLFLESLELQICVVVIACAALLTFDVATGWRWAAGIVGFLGVTAACGSYLGQDAPKKRVAG
ncbi:hypothetical protein [Streptomyces sp. NPDC001401]|uniref:hypothetical protein n=1 Tax=Streptomyces sp. NPDC001401 TaxID=3364570 RepID=UPI0036D13D97